MRDKAVLVKLTHDEMEKIRSFAKARGLGVSTLMRLAVSAHINCDGEFSHINQFLK